MSNSNPEPVLVIAREETEKVVAMCRICLKRLGASVVSPAQFKPDIDAVIIALRC